MRMTRKDFLKASVGVAGAYVSLLVLSACGGSNNSTGSTDLCASGITSTISNNHGHVLKVTLSDIQLGADKLYHIRGTATHDHTVTLTAADFTTLTQGGTVHEVSSITLGHQHPISVVCG